MVRKAPNSNCTTVLCSFSDSSEGSTGLIGTTSAVENVSGISKLCKKILKYAIHDNNGEISVKMVQNVRLVQKSWLESTTKLLRKVEEHLIALTVDGNAEDVNGKGKRLDQLVKTFGASQRLPESFLPVKLDFGLEFFRDRNYQSLSDCFTHLGSDVVELELEYPKSEGTMPSIFPPFNLPHLRKLSFQFSEEELEKIDDDDEDFADNRNGLWLLQTILNASKNLQNFVIPFSSTADVVPIGFKYLQLPVRISSLDWRINLTSKDLESVLIRRNLLPNLTSFTLQLHEKPFEDQLLFRILVQFQKTLKILRLYGIVGNGDPRPNALLQFPCMKKLKEITIDSTECELGPADALALQKFLPRLRLARLWDQTEPRLVKWIKNSKFINVVDVRVSLVNERLHSDHERFFLSPSFEILTQLHQAFPNVSTLCVSFNISDLTGLKYLFQNIIQLQVLQIIIVGNEAVLDKSSDLIDSTLLGLPLWMVEGFKKDQRSNLNWEKILKSYSLPSIRDLSELENLYFWTKSEPRNDGGLERGPISLISDLLFQHSFMKMTKLYELNFCGKFQPSLKMQEDWKRRGGLMKYIPKF